MIRITEAKPEPCGIPKPKRVAIGDIADGKIEPTLRCDDRLSWHACIDPTKACRQSHTVWLLHGHGPSPRLAVIEAVIRERSLLEEKVKVLASIEAELGTTGMTTEQMRRLEGGGM